MALEMVWELEEKMCTTGGNCVLKINTSYKEDIN
jgi:hypothetical protein